MTQADQLVTLATAFGVAIGRDLTGVGGRYAGNSRLFTDMRDGGTVGPDVYADAMSWFSAFWPADLPWPDGIERREPTGLHKRQAENAAAH
jgi:hypothetical protein